MEKHRSAILAQACLISLILLCGDTARGQVFEGLDPTYRAADIDSQIARALSEIEQRETRKARVDAEISGLGERRDAARRRLRSRTRALYRVGRSGLLPLAGGLTAMLAHMSRLERLRRMVREDLRSLNDLADRGEGLRGETGELAQQIETLRGELRSLRQRKAAVEEEQQMSALFDDAFESAPPAVQDVPGYGMRVVGESPYGAQSFASQRGRLGMPVTGTVDIREAHRGDGEGLELITGNRATVRSVSPGRVVFARTYGVYGLLVIVDHGDDFYTVFGGLGAVDVRVGDVVSRGTALGVAGTEAGRSSVFFQVRRGTRSLDAASWVGL